MLMPFCSANSFTRKRVIMEEANMFANFYQSPPFSFT